MSAKFPLVVALLTGAIITILMQSLFIDSSENNDSDSTMNENKPLYWVAPMDPNYRRDKPGKSAMGMDLVPVYANDNSADDLDDGAIYVAPHLINNFGVTTEKVKLGYLDSRISTLGYVKYDEDRLFHIHPRVDGWIETLFIKADGDPVKKGQPLYTLYSPQLVNVQEEFILVLKQGNKALINATRTRLKALHLSDTFIAQLEKTRKVQQSVTFYAPKSGVIDGLNIREGFYVKPGNTLMMIAQLSHVWVEAEVFERDASMIRVGATIDMTLDYFPQKHWKSTIDYIYPTLDEKTRTVRVRIRLENAEHLLKPNMFTDISIDVANKHQSLIVPKSAVIRTGLQNRVVMALGEGRFKSVAVEIGSVNQQEIEIISGLKENDLIVTSAQFLLDSESSIYSDFKRVNNGQEEFDEQALPQATVEGVILSIDLQEKTLEIQREAIEKWQRPAAVMVFHVSEQIDISMLTTNMPITFTFEVGERFLITDITPISPQQATMTER